MSIFFWYYLIGLCILWAGQKAMLAKLKETPKPDWFNVMFVFVFPIVYGPILLYGWLNNNDR